MCIASLCNSGVAQSRQNAARPDEMSHELPRHPAARPPPPPYRVLLLCDPNLNGTWIRKSPSFVLLEGKKSPFR